MIRCEEVQKYIADYSVDNLDADMMKKIKAHLDECLACALEMQKLEGAMSLVESYEQVEPPAYMWNAVYERITEKPKQSFVDWLRSLFASPSRALAVGFAFLILLVVMNFSKINPPSAPMAADMATQEYLQGHVMFASQDAFADRVGLTSVSAAAMTIEEAETN